MSGYEHLRLERREAVLWVHIARPHSRNALSRATLLELGRAFAAHATDPALEAAVLTGDGEEAFAAGGDLKELATVRTPEDTGALFDLACGALDEIRRFPLPTVAALNGLAVGGGAELAIACDFRVAARHAAIGFVQARLALSCGFGGGADLVQLLGPAATLRLGLAADIYDAPQALRAGLVDDIASDGETLEQCVARFLEPIARNPPQVIRAHKAIVAAARLGLPPEERRAIEREAFVHTWTHADHWAAVEALPFSRGASGRGK